MADSSTQSDDKIKKLQGQVQDVTDVMEKNIELGEIKKISTKTSHQHVIG